MEPLSYLSLLPKDVRNIVDMNVLMNMDYNQFIEACKNCKDEIWRDKGLLDFPNFDKINGKTNKAKYLRWAGRAEFLKNEDVEEEEEVLLIEMREANYRHQAKLLDFNGQYDDYCSFKYLVDVQILEMIDTTKNVTMFIPPDKKHWIVYLYENTETVDYVIKGYEQTFTLYDYHDTFSRTTFREEMQEEFDSYNKAINIYDGIITKYNN